MRFGLWLLFLFLLLFGCTQFQEMPTPAEELSVPNVTQPSENATPLNETVSEANVSEAVPIEVEANLTIANETLNESSIPMLNDTANQTTENATKIVSGLSFGEGKYALVLDDIVLDETKAGGACAAIRIVGLVYDDSVVSAVELQKEKICKESDATWISPEGRVFRIRLIDAAPGYTQIAKSQLYKTRALLRRRNCCP